MKHSVSAEQLSELQFERVWVREASFLDIDGEQSVIPAQDLQGVGIHLEVKVGLSAQGDKAAVVVRASFEPKPEQRLFLKLAAAVEGLFALRGTPDRRRLEQFATTQAPVLLVPYLRQVITTLTAQSRVGAIVLPPLNMLEITKAMRAEPGRTAVEASTQP
jgi:preprotein translocase subunit SecB